MDQSSAQQTADRIRLLREELASPGSSMSTQPLSRSAFPGACASPPCSAASRSAPPVQRNSAANIHQFSSSIHIPRPFSDQFLGLKKPLPPYKVQLRFGVFPEPWVTGVEIP